MGSANTESLQAQILAALAEIQDPDLHKDIVALNFVRDLKIEPGLRGARVSFTLELTTPACPIKERFQQEAIDRVGSLPGVHHVTVTLTSRVMASKTSKRIPGIRNIIAVGSGKGGVGKSTLSTNLTIALQMCGARVGFLDADIYGPSAQLLWGVKQMPKTREGRILPVDCYGVPLMSFSFFAPLGEAVIWRGAMIGKAVEQMLHDVDWTIAEDGTPRAELDYLIVDLPPGTGDVQLTLMHTVDVSGAVVVSTPQDLALIDATRGLAMFQKMKVPLLGVIENMTSFPCPHCHQEIDLFGQGRLEEKARERGWNFLGRVPLHPTLITASDSGIPFVKRHPKDPITENFVQIAQQISHRMSVLQRTPAEAS